MENNDNGGDNVYYEIDDNFGDGHDVDHDDDDGDDGDDDDDDDDDNVDGDDGGDENDAVVVCC